MLDCIPEALDLSLQGTSFGYDGHVLPYLAVLDLKMHIQPGHMVSQKIWQATWISLPKEANIKKEGKKERQKEKKKREVET